jgi:hypothetical protein
MTDEDRVDGRDLQRVTNEPGSDELLSEEAKVRIAEVVAEQADASAPSSARTRPRSD